MSALGDGAPSGPILVLQHADCEPPGAYEDELRARGLALHRVLLDQDGALPDWRPFAAIIVMGGSMGSYEEQLYPWLAAEKRLIAEAVTAGRPYWGVCLGAQLLASALGARVTAGPRVELGVLPVSLTHGAASDPVFADAPPHFRTLQWHGDTFELPPGAIQLARSDSYEQQAFVRGGAYGLQFHLEATSALAERWMGVPAYRTEVEQLAGPGAPADLLEQVRLLEPRSVRLARSLFANWLERIVGIPAVGLS